VVHLCPIVDLTLWCVLHTYQRLVHPAQHMQPSSTPPHCCLPLLVFPNISGQHLLTHQHKLLYISASTSSVANFWTLRFFPIFCHVFPLSSCHTKKEKLQTKKMILRYVTMLLSLRKYLPPPELVCNRDTSNFSPRYNEVYKILCNNCVLHKKKVKT
jgi:hypothetical protein